MKKIDFTNTRSINGIEIEMYNQEVDIADLHLFMSLRSHMRHNLMIPVGLITIY